MNTIRYNNWFIAKSAMVGVVLKICFGAWVTLCVTSCVALVAEQTVAVYPSKLNELVRVTVDHNGIMRMRFKDDESVQSALDVRDEKRLVLSYVRALADAVNFCPNGSSRVLIVGVGGGILPMYARGTCPVSIIDAVDIDPVVIRVAKDHFGLIHDERLRVHVADGAKFVASADGHVYDVVVLDAYQGLEVPEALRSVAFYQAVSRTVAPGGVVVSNVIQRGRNPAYDSMLAAQRAAVGSTIEIPVEGSSNVLVISRR